MQKMSGSGIGTRGLLGWLISAGFVRPAEGGFSASLISGIPRPRMVQRWRFSSVVSGITPGVIEPPPFARADLGPPAENSGR